jgi:hypothetical protein
MSPEIFHSIILIITIALSFCLVNTRFFQYDLQITALIFITYFIIKKIFPRLDSRRVADSIIFTLLILNIVNSTGGINSPLFFLNYFLIFALSLILEPVISITSTLTLVIFYLLNLPTDQSIKELLPIFSLPFLTPFAMFLGQQYIENQKLKVRGQKLQEDNYLFLSLVMKKHLQNIKEAVINFMGDHELQQIKKSSHRMEKLIEEFEKSS